VEVLERETALRADVYIAGGDPLTPTVTGLALILPCGLGRGIPVRPTALGEPYRVLREIGRGGMAVVYLADDMEHSRQIAPRHQAGQHPRSSQHMKAVSVALVTA
jgi:serine/threonine protein kinase